MSLLPTAASIAVALASIGCSTPTLEVVAADPATQKATAPAAPAPSASPAPYVEPDPHDVDGDIAVVKPAPVATTTKPHK